MCWIRIHLQTHNSFENRQLSRSISNQFYGGNESSCPHPFVSYLNKCFKERKHFLAKCFYYAGSEIVKSGKYLIRSSLANPIVEVEFLSKHATKKKAINGLSCSLEKKKTIIPRKMLYNVSICIKGYKCWLLLKISCLFFRTYNTFANHAPFNLFPLSLSAGPPYVWFFLSSIIFIIKKLPPSPLLSSGKRFLDCLP